jgi:hypothetical protein
MAPSPGKMVVAMDSLFLLMKAMPLVPAVEALLDGLSLLTCFEIIVGKNSFSFARSLVRSSHAAAAQSHYMYCDQYGETLTLYARSSRSLWLRLG